jgi:hypothetical protein
MRNVMNALSFLVENRAAAGIGPGFRLLVQASSLAPRVPSSVMDS